MLTRLGKLFLFSFLLFCIFNIATAQAQTAGSLSGSVTDESGGALPGVTVTVMKGSSVQTVYTDVDGKFSTAGLAAGMYDVRFELNGFITIEKTDVDPAAGPVVVSLKPGGLAELVVVSASRVETSLINAPATMSVVSSDTLAAAPAANYGDVLRQVPGINVIQTSARDINITSRQTTSTLATSQLALLDGRSIYLDFFGFIAWDFLPVNFDEIKQIEVIRGPASAVWGANAQTGVVNIISKSPREMQGTSVVFSGGSVNRDVDKPAIPPPPSLTPKSEGSGSLWGVNVSHAQAINDMWSFKVSAGYFNEDPLARPQGQICQSPPCFVPNTTTATGSAFYPPYKNTGTEQPKFDFRLDQEFGEKSKISYSAGVAGTSGMIHTGIGPFDISSGTKLGYGRVAYQNGNFKLGFFTNILDGDAVNLLTVQIVNGKPEPIDFIFKTQTYDFDGSDSWLIADHHILSVGANFRKNNFDLSLAPLGDNRNEAGGYVQDEIFTDKFRFVVGGRVDKFSVLDKAVFSPRLTFMYKPTPTNAFRVSYNRAFRAPSLVNNFLDVTIVSALFDPRVLGIPLAPIPILTKAIGNQNLKEESTKAFEVGYTGEINGKTTIGVTYYVNDTDNNINFTPNVFYSSSLTPPGWPLPPQVLDLLAAHGVVFPAQFTYLNLGPVRYQGIELSLDQVINSHATMNVNYSYQKDPEILNPNSADAFPATELIFAPNNRFNAGVNLDYPRWLANASVNYASDAFWTDVLDARFWGATDAYTMVNAAFGVRWMNRKVTTSLKINNMFNQQVQQHVFGDIIRRTIYGEVKFNF